MREKAAKRRRHICAGGITPAYAGKRSSVYDDSCNGTGHPRVCGEKRRMLKQTAKRPGSPPAYAGKSRKNGSYGGGKKDHPRMCGEKVLYSFGLKQVSGITPAYAGKRSPALFPLRSPEDHPRVCGEKKVMRGAKDKRMGSPPHVRGKVPSICENLERMGITPACAGKSYRSRTVLRPRWDHPRMCREKQN